MLKKILLLADISSVHTEKWALALASNGYEVGLFSLSRTSQNWYKTNKHITLVNEASTHFNSTRIFNKLKYLTVLPKLLKAIESFKPHIVHAHYATSYGLLGALSKFRPFIISAWGSDVYEFPEKSIFHRLVLRYNLSKADKILATSYALKGELYKYTRKEVEVIPFGIDTDLFYPKMVKAKYEKQSIHIGTIKAIEDKYGIKTIIEAAELIKLCVHETPFKVFLIGGGSKISHYKRMVSNLKLDNIIVFKGKIPHSKISCYHNYLDIFLNVSTVNESFGVSVIEAMACEKPVIVSNSPGLVEVVGEGGGIIVEKDNKQKLAKAIMKLMANPELRKRMGNSARKHVLRNYDFKFCLKQMTDVYTSFIPEKSFVVVGSGVELEAD